ncbi:hypothetical protein [Nocardia sp. NPDC004722]
MDLNADKPTAPRKYVAPSKADTRRKAAAQREEADRRRAERRAQAAEQRQRNEIDESTPPMPSSVRAAQVISFLFGGIGLLIAIIAGLVSGGDHAASISGRFAIPMVLAILAFWFGSAGNGLRGTVALLATLEMFRSLGSVVTKQPPGIFGVVACLAIICALIQGSAAEWFKRPR